MGDNPGKTDDLSALLIAWFASSRNWVEDIESFLIFMLSLFVCVNELIKKALIHIKIIYKRYKYFIVNISDIYEMEQNLGF